MPKIVIKTKHVYILASISSLLILAMAIWIENNYMLVPCPLCTLQRIMLTFSAIFCIILCFYDKIISKLGLFTSAALGAILAGRQVWLQSVTSDIPHSCSAGLMQLVRKYPLLDFIKAIFKNSSECSQIDYKVAGLSLAAWSLLIFISLCTMSIWSIVHKKKVDF